MQYYPDTTLPRNESAQEYECAVLVAIGAPPKGLRGFGEKEESWQRLVGFNGLLWNIVRLNQPNANLMPISQKHRASLVNSTILLKIPQITQKNATFIVLGLPRLRQRSRKSPAYMPHVTRTHANAHNAPQHNGFSHTHVTQHNPNGIKLMPLHKSLDSGCYGLGSDLN
tara:strand:- start:266 stop:772 length:507 start_codon:yes stop_codon:yes gene_type:complete